MSQNGLLEGYRSSELLDSIISEIRQLLKADDRPGKVYFIFQNQGETLEEAKKRQGVPEDASGTLYIFNWENVGKELSPDFEDKPIQRRETLEDKDLAPVLEDLICEKPNVALQEPFRTPPEPVAEVDEHLSSMDIAQRIADGDKELEKKHGHKLYRLDEFRRSRRGPHSWMV